MQISDRFDTLGVGVSRDATRRHNASPTRVLPGKATTSVANVSQLPPDRIAYVMHRLRTLAQLSDNPNPHDLVDALYAECKYNNALDLCAAIAADPCAAEERAALALQESEPYLRRNKQGGQK